MADGYRKKRVAWEEKRKRSGKKEKKREEMVCEGKDKTQTWALQCEYIYKNAIVTLFP